MDVDARGRSNDPLIGRLLDGRYRIGPRIARGGMASVHEATDTRLDRIVAVKVMHAGLGDDDEFAARFVREARAAARLTHPHVVSVYDQGDDDGTVYLAMEYVPGHTLRDVIRKESPMPPLRALALIEPVVSALAAAHRAGLVHRDIKPENVLISDEAHGSRVKVADFGLARAVSADTQHTATGGVLIGTVSYLAPELVVDGRSDARADVYALGVVLYEMLTGQRPHDGESPIAVAYKHVHDDVPPPSESVPGIPAYLDALVARATSRDRDNRPADAGVLLHQVHRVRQALLDGLATDDDLTADLMPQRTAPIDLPTEPTDEPPVAAAAPVATPAADDAQRTTALRFTDDDLPDRARPLDTDEIADPHDAGPPPAAVTARGAGRPRRRGRGPWLVLLTVLLVAGLAAGAWWFTDGRYTSTPGVLGETRAVALDRLEAAGLDPELGEPAFSETVPKGEVLSTDPAPGDRVLPGGTVEVVVSLGKERYAVPTLKGLTEDAAQDRLAASHLTFGESTSRFSETVPSGRVIAQSVAPATKVKPDTVVDLVLSKGRRPIAVTDFTGRSGDRAEQALERRGLDVTVKEAYDDSVREGRVISQTPASGTLHRGDTVTLTVSLGPELVAVPDVVPYGVDAATQTLEDAGFVVEIQGDDEEVGLGFVIRTDPDAGTMLPRGSTVTLYLI